MTYMALHVITEFDFFMGQWNISVQASFIALIKDRVGPIGAVADINAVSSHSSITGSLLNLIPCTPVVWALLFIWIRV